MVVRFVSEFKSLRSLIGNWREIFMSVFLENLSIVSSGLARFVASELSLQLLTKEDLVKCLKEH